MAQKTVLITGASRGIGAEAARTFARAGYAVAVNYCRAQAEAEALVAALRAEGAAAMAVQADVSDPQQVQRMVDNVLDNFCQLDILLCSAGTAWTGLLGDMSDAEWEKLRGCDLDGVFYACRAVYPHMVRQKSGKIITISSMWGISGASCEAGYSACKAGVIGLTRALAQELGPCGITVNCLAPGVIDTEMNQNLSPEDLAALAEATPLGRIGTPQDVANAALFLASDAANFITGAVLGVDGGFLLGV